MKKIVIVMCLMLLLSACETLINSGAADSRAVKGCVLNETNAALTGRVEYFVVKEYALKDLDYKEVSKKLFVEESEAKKILSNIENAKSIRNLTEKEKEVVAFAFSRELCLTK